MAAIRKSRAVGLAGVLVLVGMSLATAADKVTIDNFVRAETDRYFKQRVEQGCLGQWCHDREPAPIDRQPIIRMNRDTPYSVAIFDLS
ncbi:MAG: carboxylesterase, partial [Pseudolabrys sp.]